MQTVDVLVLGSTGRVGRLLRGALAGSEALRVGLLPPEAEPRAPRLLWQCRRGADGPDSLKWHPGRPLPEGLRARAVLALWGVTSGPQVALAQNAALARAALHLARRVGAERVIHLSSGAVQAGLTGAPAREDAPLAPLGPYGAAKVEMEQAIRDWHARQGTCAPGPEEGPARADTAPPSEPRSLILRLGNVAGADSLARALAQPGPVTLDRFGEDPGDPEGEGPRRSYLGIEDLARCLAALLRLPAATLPPVLNLAGPTPVAMAEIARAAGREVLWRPAPARALPLLSLDTTRLDRLTGPLPDSADAAALLAQWHRAEGGQ